MPHIVHRDDIKPLVGPEGWQRLDLVGGGVSAELDAGLELSILAPNATTPRHYHTNCEHYLFIVTGDGQLLLDDGAHDIAQGYLVAIDPEERHALRNTSDTDLEYLEFFVPRHAMQTIIEED